MILLRTCSALTFAALVAGCPSESPSAPAAIGESGRPTKATAAAPSSDSLTSLTDCPGDRLELAPGLELLRIVPARRTAVPSPDNCLRVVRADPTRYRVSLGAQLRDGAALTADRWANANAAAAVINASMFHDGGQSTGLLVDRGRVLSTTINKKFGGFFAAEPRSGDRPAATIWGRPCGGTTLAALRRDYATVVQNYRLLECDGSPIAWKDDKVYSAAAVGIDRSGRVLFLHSRAPYKMSVFTEIIADPKNGLDLAGAMYVEGGPEATLYVSVGDSKRAFVGSYETGFLENHDNVAAWPLPNVLMLIPRKPTP